VDSLFITSSDRFELKDQPNPLFNLVGEVALNLGNVGLSLGASASNRRILGYRFREFIVPLGRPVYALGRIVPDSFEATAFRLEPAEGLPGVIVSYDSPEKLRKDLESSIYWWNVATLVTSAVGGVLVGHSLYEMGTNPSWRARYERFHFDFNKQIGLLFILLLDTKGRRDKGDVKTESLQHTHPCLDLFLAIPSRLSCLQVDNRMLTAQALYSNIERLQKEYDACGNQIQDAQSAASAKSNELQETIDAISVERNRFQELLR
jgi:hypothetical protein